MYRFFFYDTLSGGQKTAMGPFQLPPVATNIFENRPEGAFWANKGPESAFLDAPDKSKN